MRRLILVGLLLTGCGPLSMDSFDEWEPAVDSYLEMLGPEARSSFADDAHAVAFALSTDCFATAPINSPLDQLVAESCSSEFGILSEIMTMGDLCAWVDFDGNRDVDRINGGKICHA